MKRISVIIPCYNVEKYIDRALKSLQLQTIGMDCLEIICLDDKSTDKTLERLEFWEKKYPNNMIVVALARNGRQGTARNIGLSYATCDYISFIDADDWVEKDYFKVLYDIATQGDYDLVQCDCVRDSSETLSFNEASTGNNPLPNDLSIRIQSDSDRKEIFRRKIITNTPPMKLIRKSLLTENRIFFSEGIAYEDSYWGILLNMYVTKAYLTGRPLYHYYVNSSSTVLTKNEIYHVDLLTNQILIWDELKHRGFMSDFKDEIEIEHVYSCALIFWKMIVYRYDTPPYSLYRLLCAVVREHIPDIMENPYVKNGSLPELHQLLLSSCFNIMAKAEFESFAQNVRTIGL